MPQMKFEKDGPGPEVVNMRHCDPPWGQPGDVRIDRGSGYGNPFYIGKDGTRDEVCDKYERWFRGKKMDVIPLLTAKRLGCWCVPERCHGEFLKKIVVEFKKGLAEE